MTAARLKPADRLGIALFLAALFHLVLILGLRFRMPKPGALRSLDVTLVQTRTPAKPQTASRRAQVNTRGGGGVHRHHAAHSPFAATHTGGGTPKPRRRPHTTAAHQRRFRILRVRQSPLTLSFVKPTWQLQAAISEQMGISRRIAAEAAQLRAEIRRDLRNTQTAGQGHGGVSARRFAYARYIMNWNRRMERIGSRAYAATLAARHLTGSLVLEARIARNGQLEAVKILRPSPYPALDRAAIAIVRGAAPFPPLPAVSGGAPPSLAIIRTWRFRGGRMAGAGPVQTLGARP